jgi:hypothetical protein
VKLIGPAKPSVCADSFLGHVKMSMPQLSDAPPIPRERTNERGASGARCFGTQQGKRAKKSCLLSSSSARVASTNAQHGMADASGDLPQEGDQSRVFGCGEPTRADDNLHGVRCRGKETDNKLGDLQRDHSGSPAYGLQSAAVCFLVVRKETLVEGRVPRVSDTS